jgi:RimJ/RimL family protein N-acetyltransferase
VIPPLPGPSDLADDVVRLRPWKLSDAPALAAAWQDVEIAARLPVPGDRDRTAATRWIEGWEPRRRAGSALDLVICESPDDDVCGEIGLSRIDMRTRAALIGWWLADGSRGRGLASRAVLVMAQWALGSGWLDALVAEIDADNERSLRLATRCGFVQVRDEPRSPQAEGRQAHVLRLSSLEPSA